MSEENLDKEENGVDCGVEGVKADDMHNEVPVFDVDEKSFFNNMKMERNRMRFPNGSGVSKFMQGTRYRKPFFMRYTNGKGEKFLKKVK